MHSTNKAAARFGTTHSTEWGRKSRKAEARKLRGTARQAWKAEANRDR